ncbi:hypothetical protein [Rhizobium leguminosarum]|jgi:chromosome segregation ATPase|uniref:hypothetical protein n=1 Tax=Rhizobium leguminosarum TaxID=384 RepID=UPI002E14C80A|nr:hypothetical protein U8Q02_36425 [Rhizobium leguminosarum]
MSHTTNMNVETLVNPHTDRQIEDFANSGQLMARAASDSLKAMAETRNRTAEKVSQAISDLRGQNASLTVRLAEAERHAAQASAENAGLKRSLQSLIANHRRLHMCFVSLLKSVEDVCGDAISVEQRVEAMIQAQDFGVSNDVDLDIVTNRMKSFMQQTNADLGFGNN